MSTNRKRLTAEQWEHVADAFRLSVKDEMRVWAEEARELRGAGTVDARCQCREIRKQLGRTLAEFDRLIAAARTGE